MRLRVITTTEELQTLRADWNRLLRSTAMNAVQLTHEWIECWWKSFGSRAELHVLLLFNEENELTGIIPLMRSESRYRGINIKKLSLLANGHSPSSDIITATFDLENVVYALFEHVKNLPNWDVLDLHKISRSSLACEYILKHMVSQYPYGIKENIQSPFIVVNTSWPMFLKERSCKFRKVLRNKINRANRAGDLKFEKIAIPDSRHPALARMIEISSRSWKGLIGKDLKSNPESLRFHLLLADSLGRRGMVYLWFLKKGHLPIGFEYHLVYNAVVYPIRADYDEQYRKLSPGTLLEHHILETLFTESTIREYYSCGDNYPYLLNWTDMIRQHINIEVFNKKTLPLSLHSFEYDVLPVVRKLRVQKIWNNKDAVNLRTGIS